MDTSNLNASTFAYLLLQLNGLVDSGKHDDLTIADVYEHIQDRSVLQWLGIRMQSYGDFEELYANYLKNMDCYRGRELHKWGVEKRGLCLLIAWTIEVFQHGSEWTPDDEMFRTPED